MTAIANSPKRDDSATHVKHRVLDMYMAHPFPQWTKEERHRRLATEIARYTYLGFADAVRGARMIDVGCGTGNRTIAAAKRFGVGELVGLDQSTASLAVARRVAEEEGLDTFVPLEGDLFHIPYPDGYFDVAVSWGVLHHTHDPYAGFKELIRVCKPGGYVGIFLYNKWAHWRHNMQKARVDREAGDDVEKRFEVAHRLYGTKPIERMTPEEVAVFYDQYCHPHKSDHTIEETLEWFEHLGITYWGSYPALPFRDALSLLRFRGRLAAQHPLHNPGLRMLATLAANLPGLPPPSFPAARPSRLNILAWQLLLAWQGRHGEYSGGTSLCGRKRA